MVAYIYCMKLTTDERVTAVFEGYPADVKKHMLNLRSLVIDVAENLESVIEMEETLKWGEPSYITKFGSTVRMDWKPKAPESYALYFSCSTKLVDTFRAIYQDTFRYEGKRALVFQIQEELPKLELRQCIALALTYHKVKHLPLLGI